MALWVLVVGAGLPAEHPEMQTGLAIGQEFEKFLLGGQPHAPGSSQVRRMRAMGLLKRAALTIALSTAAFGQDGGIEIFAGETIFTSGTRVSVTEVWKVKKGLIDGPRT